MKKVMIAVLLLMMAWTSNAQAAEKNAWEGFWESVGGFVHNCWPGNWGQNQ